MSDLLYVCCEKNKFGKIRPLENTFMYGGSALITKIVIFASGIMDTIKVSLNGSHNQNYVRDKLRVILQATQPKLFRCRFSGHTTKINP